MAIKMTKTSIINNYPQILAMRGLVQEHKARSAWEKGVKLYAFDLLDTYEESIDYQHGEQPCNSRLFVKALLNGADSWNQYSWGGCSLIYDEDIAERLCTQTELCRTGRGRRRPNSREEWLDTQARALYQAAELLIGFFEATIDLQKTIEEVTEISA